MVSLLLWVCLAATPTECRVIQIADGFISDKQCVAYAPLMVAGWVGLHPALKIREGTRPLCTGQANYLLHRFGA